MKTYLRLINPVVAAKGLFCGTALFLLGRILLVPIERPERDDAAGRPSGHQGDSPRA